MTHTYDLIEATVSMDTKKENKENQEIMRSSVLDSFCVFLLVCFLVYKEIARERFLVAYLKISSGLASAHLVIGPLGSLLSTREARAALGNINILTLLSCLATSRVHPKFDGLPLTINQFFHNNLVS